MGAGGVAFTETGGCGGERAPEMGPRPSPLAAPHRCAVTLGAPLSSPNRKGHFHAIVRFWWELEYRCGSPHTALEHRTHPINGDSRGRFLPKGGNVISGWNLQSVFFFLKQRSMSFLRGVLMTVFIPHPPPRIHCRRLACHLFFFFLFLSHLCVFIVCDCEKC